jgi:hypothetical protein
MNIEVPTVTEPFALPEPLISLGMRGGSESRAPSYTLAPLGTRRAAPAYLAGIVGAASRASARRAARRRSAASVLARKLAASSISHS